MLFFFLIFFFFFPIKRSTSAATHSSRTLHLARDVMQLPAYLVPLDGTIRQGFTPSCRIPTTRAAMTSLCAPHKHTSHSEGLPTRTHVLRPSVTCAVRSANRTPCAGHVELHTHARVKNPSIPNPSTQPTFCPSRDRQHSPRTFPDRVSLPQPRTRRSRAKHGPNLALAAG